MVQGWCEARLCDRAVPLLSSSSCFYVCNDARERKGDRLLFWGFSWPSALAQRGFQAQRGRGHRLPVCRPERLLPIYAGAQRGEFMVEKRLINPGEPLVVGKGDRLLFDTAYRYLSLLKGSCPLFSRVMRPLRLSDSRAGSEGGVSTPTRTDTTGWPGSRQIGRAHV